MQGHSDLQEFQCNERSPDGTRCKQEEPDAVTHEEQSTPKTLRNPVFSNPDQTSWDDDQLTAFRLRTRPNYYDHSVTSRTFRAPDTYRESAEFTF
ncbi:hypothetical protein NDU88_006389 [Pleurodeles waltl]|uniref:Uncharacterized protein n=1 Tax=Pleurodeles waltl TaxID=8319 RepID=A0AAV7MDR6_PLEWA|nr:hypothetical protein NDU88_006389 [Pleurodeles waltl]